MIYLCRSLSIGEDKVEILCFTKPGAVFKPNKGMKNFSFKHFINCGLRWNLKLFIATTATNYVCLPESWFAINYLVPLGNTLEKKFVNLLQLAHLPAIKAKLRN